MRSEVSQAQRPELGVCPHFVGEMSSASKCTNHREKAKHNEQQPPSQPVPPPRPMFNTSSRPWAPSVEPPSMASSTFGQTVRRDVDDDELVMGRATMKRNSASLVAGLGGPGSSSWQAPPPHAAGKENFGSGKHLAPSVARIGLGPAQLSSAGAAPSTAAPSARLPAGSRPTWQINDEQMHQPWGAHRPPRADASRAPSHAHNRHRALAFPRRACAGAVLRSLQR